MLFAMISWLIRNQKTRKKEKLGKILWLIKLFQLPKVLVSQLQTFVYQTTKVIW